MQVLSPCRRFRANCKHPTHQERIGGSDDESETGQAANVAKDQDPEEDGTAAEGDETTGAGAGAETTTTGATASAQEMAVISEENMASGEGSVDAGDTDGVRESGNTSRKGGTLSSPDQTTTDLAHDAEPASLAFLSAAAAVNGGDDRNLTTATVTPSPTGCPAIGASNEAAPSDPPARDESTACGVLPPNGVSRQPETRATDSQPGNRKDAAPGGSCKKGEKQPRSGRARQTPERAGNESKATEESNGSDIARSKDDDAPKKAATLEKKEGGMEELLENTVSRTVDCLIYIRWYVGRTSDTVC